MTKLNDNIREDILLKYAKKTAIYNHKELLNQLIMTGRFKFTRMIDWWAVDCEKRKQREHYCRISDCGSYVCMY